VLWTQASDGVRLRCAVWGEAPFALVLSGRSEHLEKYAPVADRLQQLGFGMLSLDWRGQGLSERQTADGLGYVRDFTDYQLDIDAALAAFDLPLADIPLLVAHSAGALAARRYLHRSDHIRAAVFSGPMFALKRQGPFDPLLYTVVQLATRLGLGHRLLPGSTQQPTVIAKDFDGNPLTRSRARWDTFHAQLSAHPELGVGGMTLAWISASIAEIRAVRHWPAPEVPTLVLLGSSEDVVSTTAVKDYAAQTPMARLEIITEAEHEVLMENPAIETQVWSYIKQLLEDTNLS